MRALLFCSSIVLFVAGCSGGAADTTSSGAGAGKTSTSSSGSTGTGGAGFDAGGVVTTYTTGEGPIALAAGEEETNCITVRLGNPEGAYVRRVTAELSPGSHHMIVYASTDTTEAPTPTPCAPLAGILEGQHPFFIAQQGHAELTWPDDENNDPIGFQLAADQMVKVEFHTINTTSSPLMVTGKAIIETIPLSTPNVTPSDMAFWGTKNFTIPPHEMYSTPVDYQYGIPGTKSFAVTTHQHHLGVQMQVWYASSETDTSDRIANGLSWSDPPLNLLNPPISFPADGSKLLTYQCTWDNPTTDPVTFGESYYDEMCFVWHYYYPSQGFQACIDHLCINTP
jgi:hypothetical protein